MNKLTIALAAAMTLVGAQAFAAEPAAEAPAAAPAKTASHHHAKATHHHARKASHQKAKAGPAARPAAQ